MTGISKQFFVVLVFLFCNFSLCLESEEHKYISFLDKPSFSITSLDKEITITGETSSLLNSSKFTIQIPNFKLNSNNLSVNIASKEAVYNKKIGHIKFKDSVNLQALNKNDNLLISSEEMIFDLTNATFSSVHDVFTNFNNIEIQSHGIEMTQREDNLYTEFSKGIFQIKNIDSINKGYANKLYIISEDNKIILEEEAILDQDGLIIRSDLIHYDYNLNKILKSINSIIENNS